MKLLMLHNPNNPKYNNQLQIKVSKYVSVSLCVCDMYDVFATNFLLRQYTQNRNEKIKDFTQNKTDTQL